MRRAQEPELEPEQGTDEPGLEILETLGASLSPPRTLVPVPDELLLSARCPRRIAPLALLPALIAKLAEEAKLATDTIERAKKLVGFNPAMVAVVDDDEVGNR